MPIAGGIQSQSAVGRKAILDAAKGAKDARAPNDDGEGEIALAVSPPWATIFRSLNFRRKLRWSDSKINCAAARPQAAGIARQELAVSKTAGAHSQTVLEALR